MEAGLSAMPMHTEEETIPPVQVGYLESGSHLDNMPLFVLTTELTDLPKRIFIECLRRMVL